MKPGLRTGITGSRSGILVRRRVKTRIFPRPGAGRPGLAAARRGRPSRHASLSVMIVPAAGGLGKLRGGRIRESRPGAGPIHFQWRLGEANQLPGATAMNQCGMTGATSMHLGAEGRRRKHAACREPACSIERMAVLAAPPATGRTSRAGFRDTPDRRLDARARGGAGRNVARIRARQCLRKPGRG